MHAMIADAGQQHQRLPVHGSEHFVSDLDVHATQCGTPAARAASPDTSEMFLEYSSGALPGPRPQGEAPAKLHTGEPVSGRRTNAAPGSWDLSTGESTTHRRVAPRVSPERIAPSALRARVRNSGGVRKPTVSIYRRKRVASIPLIGGLARCPLSSGYARAEDDRTPWSRSSWHVYPLVLTGRNHTLTVGRPVNYSEWGRDDFTRPVPSRTREPRYLPVG